jgi:hypothetical protein
MASRADPITYPPARPPRESLLLLALGIAGCLLGGVVLGILVGRPLVGVVGLPATATARPPTPAATAPATISILLLGVDSLTASQPQLEACWVLTFQPGVPHYYLLGFSPSVVVTVPGLATASSLRDIYAMDRKIDRGESYFIRDALRVISPGLERPQAEVIYDRRTLAASVDLLDGITLSGERYTGQALLGRYDALPREDQAGRLTFQGDILSALTEAIRQQGFSPESLRPHFNLGQEWRPNPGWFTALAEAEHPLTGARFFINLAPLGGSGTPAP